MYHLDAELCPILHKAPPAGKTCIHFTAEPFAAQKIPNINKINEKSSFLATLENSLSVFVACSKMKYALLFMQQTSILLKT